MVLAPIVHLFDGGEPIYIFFALACELLVVRIDHSTCILLTSVATLQIGSYSGFASLPIGYYTLGG